jgi:4-amino-4-deoxy-L-arabinose transferase-like glycosyltransferase
MARKMMIQGLLKRSFVSVVILTVIVNIALLFYVAPQVSNRLHIHYNQDNYADGYDYLAANIASGHGYRFYPDTARTIMREPGYPILLAGILLAFGKSFVAIKITNVCLALATAWLMTRLAVRVSSAPIMVFAPSLLFLFHPATLIAEDRGGVEILFTFLIVLFMVALYRALENNLWWGYALAGASLGLTVLVKSTPILFPLVLLGYLMAVDRKRRWSASGHIALMIVSLFAVLSPWIIRNYSLTGKFIPTASVLGVSAQAGQYMCEHRSSGEPLWQIDREAAYERDDLARSLGYRFKSDDFYYQTFYATADELNFSSYLANRVKGNYEQHPLLCVKCIASNLIWFWTAGKTKQATIANTLIQLPYLALGIAGVVLSLKNGTWRVIGPMVLFVVYIVCVHAPILAQARYSMPLIPFISIFAAVAIEWARRNRACSTALDAAINHIPSDEEGVPAQRA